MPQSFKRLPVQLKLSISKLVLEHQRAATEVAAVFRLSEVAVQQCVTAYQKGELESVPLESQLQWLQKRVLQLESQLNQARRQNALLRQSHQYLSKSPINK